ncbi:hypothetical protein [Acidaminococcus fermentans]|uniref:hypothetical protein n=1 Tax=Acidaminococcus fermentans TaxID=905 RepID=UPI0024318E37|nr:hypothetical protein [Acidaminococcus fermentans]MDD6287595.1 hypothetical protein [Acidaminococcus fermentans]
MKVRTMQADPSGNVTLYVLDPVPQKDRKELNRQLLTLHPSVEQAGCLSIKEGQPQVEMMGGEFCGNATRSAGACALYFNGEKEGEFQVTCSGCPVPLTVRAKKVRENLYEASVQLPPPLSMKKIRLSYERESVECQEVVFPGITHYVYFTLNVDEVDQDQLFYSLQREISRGEEPEAYGLMLVEMSTLKVIPIVYVSATGTLYHENSCGSGSAAVAAALTQRQKRSLAATLQEPGGRIDIETDWQAEKLVSITIGGPVRLGPETLEDTEKP